MSVLEVYPGRTERESGLNVSSALGVFAIGLGLLIWEARFRLAEASASAWLIRNTHLLHANSLGVNVLFPLHGRWVGFNLSVACTSAVLMVPFFGITGLLILFGRVQRGRALGALAIACAVLFAVNQLRLLTIAASMVWWGFETGYQRSHILLGTALSTIGVIIGIIIFVWMLVDSGTNRRPGHPDSGAGND